MFGNILRLQGKSNILVDREMRIQRVTLEHHGNAALTRREIVYHFSADKDFAGRGRFQAGDHPQERGFPGTRRSQENQKLAFAGFQIYFINCSELSLLKYLGQFPRFNYGHSGSSVYLNLSKMRLYSASAVLAASSGVALPLATVANIVGITQLLNAWSIAAVQY